MGILKRKSFEITLIKEYRLGERWREFRKGWLGEKWRGMGNNDFANWFVVEVEVMASWKIFSNFTFMN